MVADPPRRHHHPRRAGAALGGAAPGERLERRWVERLDRVHTSAAHLVGRDEARVDGEAVEMDCAGAALTFAAALLRARKPEAVAQGVDRKSTRLNSSHSQISYAVFCLKK